MWTESRIHIVKQGYESGLAARVIAEQLGISKSAVIGKANRLGLEHPRPPVRRQVKQILKHVRGYPYTPPNTCQYIHGDVPNHRYCGGKVVPGKPYCEEHCRICYRQPEEQR